MHINCGGKATIVGNIQYEEDEDTAGAAKFAHGRENWGFSSTGSFWDVKTVEKIGYIANNVSILTMNESELYTNARQSPLSFTYYARCLANGTYKVKLHFAEIVFRDIRSVSSLGRRIFDIYVQVFCQIYFVSVYYTGGVPGISLSNKLGVRLPTMTSLRLRKIGSFVNWV